MVPRTVQMAKEVASVLTSTQLDTYGNIILNGYASVVANTVNKKAWQYAETLTAPVNLPSLTDVRPALKGWTNQYQEYFTRLQPNGYGVNPGDPTMFNYNIHSFLPTFGPIATIGGLQSGQGYTPGVYTNVNAIGVYGTGAKLTVTVDATGRVASAVPTVAGTGYAANTGLTANIGPGYGFAVFITSVTPTTPLGQPQWARPPRRYNQFAANPTATPPQYVNNPLAIQYSFMAPQADTPITPPIDYVT